MSDQRADRRAARRVAWFSTLGTLLIRLLGATWRVRLIHTEAYAARHAAGQPVIYVLWHGQMLPLLYAHRNSGAAVLISDHADGEIIARIATALGFRSVRGSSSHGAARALIGLVRELRSGCDIAVTPDGPRGPARSVAPGTLIAAQRSEMPLLPMGVTVDRAWRLRTWDSFLIPKPFARVTIAYGPFATVPAPNARAAGEAGEWLQQIMNDAEQLAVSS